MLGFGSQEDEDEEGGGAFGFDLDHVIQQHPGPDNRVQVRKPGFLNRLRRTLPFGTGRGWETGERTLNPLMQHAQEAASTRRPVY